MMSRFAVGLFSLGLSIASGAQTLHDVSPDGKWRAEISSFANAEAEVTIKGRNGQSLAWLNLQSQSHRDGAAIERFQWSANSAWFVFTTRKLGVGGSGFYPAYFYSRKSETFRSVDDRVGLSARSADFQLENEILRLRITPDEGSRGDAFEPTMPAAFDLKKLDDHRN